MPITSARYRLLNRLTVAKANAQLLKRVPWQLPEAQRARLLQSLAAIEQAITDIANELATELDEEAESNA